jgi:hypothetical protein
MITPRSRSFRLRRWLGRTPTPDEKLRAGEIRWRWRQACEGAGLSRLVYPPSGPARAVPRIGQVDLGPPTTFTVRLLSGQLPADVEAAAKRIAAAMAVPQIGVTSLPSGWVAIELITLRPTLAVVPPTRPRHGAA